MGEARLRFTDATMTHPGRVRSDNEDCILARPEAGVWLVADGMGGHANGQWASMVIASALNGAQLPDDFDAAGAAVAEAIHAANQRIWTEAQAIGASMGSTAVALLLRGDRFAVFWAGDSRCYLFRAGALHQLTTDHSQVQDMVAAGRLTPEEAESHPMAHVLSRAVGVEPQLQLDAVSDEAMVDDIFLICSDGLTRTVPDAELAAVLARHRPAAGVEQLVKLCLERGAPDNVSLVVVACEAATQLAFA
ncbi:MAG: PP2C family protein-serine/threonine phosphatase [Phenylobacterium sp.]